VEKLNIAVIRVTNWYIDPIHFKLDYFPLDITFRADSEPTPFPEGITGYIGTTTQYPDDKHFLIKALDKVRPTTICFVLRPAMKLTLYIFGVQCTALAAECSTGPIRSKLWVNTVSLVGSQ
jgi:hypothetical protein